MPKEVSFVIRLDDKGTFKKVTVDAEELGRAVRSVPCLHGRKHRKP